MNRPTAPKVRDGRVQKKNNAARGEPYANRALEVLWPHYAARFEL